LLKQIGSLDKVKEADKEVLSKVKGITKRDVETVYTFYH